MDSAIAVLGCPAFSNGQPRPALWRRLQKAWELAQIDPQCLVFVSGGQHRGPCEADVMAAWLVAHGIAQDRIIKERRATSTDQNAHYLLPLFRRHSVQKIYLVTERFHMRRSLALMAHASQVADWPLHLQPEAAADGKNTFGRAQGFAYEQLKLWADMARHKWASRRQ